MRLTERNPLIIGTIAIVVIVLGTLAALTIKGSTFSPTYPLSADFRDTAGLSSGDLITIAGVSVGHVGGIRQDGDAVRVTLDMNHGVQVARGSTVAIKVATLLGRKEVAISAPPGANWNDLYRKGDHIAALGTSPTEVLEVQADAQAALQSLDTQALNGFLADLSQVTAGKATQIGNLIDGLNRLTGTVDARSSQISSLIDAANAVSGTVESHNQNLLSMIDSLDAVVSNLDARRTQLTQLLTSTEQAAGQLSGVIGANRDKLTAALDSLQASLGVINQHQVDLAQTISYLAGAIQGFSSVGYSGPQSTPNKWANIITVGVGPASGDPLFGCDGEFDLLLTKVIGPDPVTNCAQYSGPLPGAAPGSGAQAGPNTRTPTVPGGPAPSSTSTTSTTQPLDSLLGPLLGGGR